MHNVANVIMYHCSQSFHIFLLNLDRENSNNSSSSGLGEGLDGRINLISDRDFRERNDALRIDTGNDKQGTGLRIERFSVR